MKSIKGAAFPRHPRQRCAPYFADWLGPSRREGRIPRNRHSGAAEPRGQRSRPQASPASGGPEDRLDWRSSRCWYHRFDVKSRLHDSTSGFLAMLLLLEFYLYVSSSIPGSKILESPVCQVSQPCSDLAGSFNWQKSAISLPNFIDFLWTLPDLDQ